MCFFLLNIYFPSMNIYIYIYIYTLLLKKVFFFIDHSHSLSLSLSQTHNGWHHWHRYNHCLRKTPRLLLLHHRRHRKSLFQRRRWNARATKKMTSLWRTWLLHQRRGLDHRWHQNTHHSGTINLSHHQDLSFFICLILIRVLINSIPLLLLLVKI